MPDQNVGVVELEDLLARHMAEPFPSDLDKGESYGGADPVMIGADICGWAQTVAAGGQLRVDQRKGLAHATASLREAIGELPESARPYYQRVVEIGETALRQER